MLDLKFIRENKEAVIKNCADRKVVVDIERLLSLDTEKRNMETEIGDLRAKRNAASKTKPTPEVIAEMKRVGERIAQLEKESEPKEKKLLELSWQVPNMASADTPIGPDESGNKVIRKWGTPPKFSFTPLDHIELGKKLDLIDVENATKITGARFNYLKNEAALLEYAIVLFVFSILTDKKIIAKIAREAGLKNFKPTPFIPVVPPVMVKPEVFRRMGRLSEADKDEKYYLPQDDLYLIGSAEHTLGPLHMDSIIDEKDLPIRYIGFSSAFRREAGSYGKDTKGILRVHQFDKLEMESFYTLDKGLDEQNFIVAIQEYLMRSLELPYQAVQICTGDMSRPDYRQIDIETWIPTQNKYRETHTSDYMTDFQARRLNTKVKRTDGRVEYMAMNDATAFAIGRIMIAILENHQQDDGSIKIPNVLRKYMGGRKKIKKKK